MSLRFLGSPLRPYISSAIIKLNEEGVIARLKTKWWEKERGGGACASADETASAGGGVANLNLQVSTAVSQAFGPHLS